MATAAVGIIDAHLHLWQRSRFEYSWIASGSPLDRDFLPDDLYPLMRAHGLIGGVLIEAANREAELDWLLAISESDVFQWGVIGWVDLKHTGAVGVLGRYADHQRFRGIRINWFAPTPSLEQFQAAFETAGQHALIVEILTHVELLPALLPLLRQHPDITFVLNHFAGVALSMGNLRNWEHQLQPIAHLPNTILKLSGYLSPNGQLPAISALRAFLHAALRLFGVQRVMFGSNYPVCLRAASYSEVLNLLCEAVADLEQAEQRALFYTTAARVYQLFSHSKGETP